jgi:formylglycine-generating enzyme
MRSDETGKAQTQSCCPPMRGTPAGPSAGALRGGEIAAPPGLAEAVWLPGGSSFVGTDLPFLHDDGEAPRRPVRLKPFGIERSCVTNTRFRDFVMQTGYVTDAERYGWSFVFADLVDAEVARAALSPVEASWWLRVDGACWREPEGSGSDIEGRLDHPATHISWNDAGAFARWAGGRLPTEAEWEYAARGGRSGPFPWGDEEPTDQNPLCNIWQGRFPDLNLGTDGYLATAPVISFQPNSFGLYNTVGNVWEWCSDVFRIRSLSSRAKQRNAEAASQKQRVLKGGSFLCHRSYCYRYRVAARIGREPDSGASHLGFRIAYDPPREA